MGAKFGFYILGERVQINFLNQRQIKEKFNHQLKKHFSFSSEEKRTKTYLI